MKKTELAMFMLLVLAAAEGWAGAEELTIYEIQYTTDANGVSPYAGSIVDCRGGIVTHKYGGLRPKLTIQDPDYPDGWGAIQVKDWLGGAPLFNKCAVGDRIKLTNVFVEEYRGNTTLQCWLGNSPDLTVISSGNQLPEAIVVDVSEIASPLCECVGGECDCYVADHNAERYEHTRLRVENVVVTEMGLGKAADNYVLLDTAAAGDANRSCWASDYMNSDVNGYYHSYVQQGARFCAVEGILEQYTNISEGWDYYQLVTTASEDFTLAPPGDLDANCLVDFVDFGLFSPWWRNNMCASCAYCEGADLNRSGAVDWIDVGVFAARWLEEP